MQARSADLHLTSHAKELAEQRHHDHAGQVDNPPLPASREAVVKDGATKVDELRGHCEVEALFCALDNDGEKKTAVGGVGGVWMWMWVGWGVGVA